MTSFFKSLIAFYRTFLSPLCGGGCRFYPTCSVYALESLDRLPLKEAMKNIIMRLFSCHPFHPGGVDPVPNFLKGRSL